MSDRLPSINLDIAKKLRRDRVYRHAFFLAESSSLIAKQLIELRKRRGLNQKQVAEAVETGQPAISRVERADYRNWSFNTLRRLAEAMDARLRVIIEPSEDVLVEYESPKDYPGKGSPQASSFSEWLKHRKPYDPVAFRKTSIAEENDSAVSFGEPIEQRLAKSILDEGDEQQSLRQRDTASDTIESTGAVWN